MALIGIAKSVIGEITLIDPEENKKDLDNKQALPLNATNVGLPCCCGIAGMANFMVVLPTRFVKTK